MSDPQALLLVRETLVRDRREARERRLARACRRLVGRRSIWSRLVGRQARGDATPTVAVCCAA